MAANNNEKPLSDRLEDLETVHTHVEPDDLAALSTEHRNYLLQRHGTLELDPVPDMSDADPYNWTTAKVIVIEMYIFTYGLQLTPPRNAPILRLLLSTP